LEEDMKKIFLTVLLIFFIGIIPLNLSVEEENKIEKQEKQENIEYTEDIELMDGDESFPIDKNSTLAKTGYELIEMVNEFTAEITNKSYKTIKGDEGYGYLSDSLVEKLKKLDDAKKTYKKYVSNELIKIIKHGPYTSICFENENNATSFTSVIEGYTHGLGKDVQETRNILIILDLIKVDEKWVIDNIIFQ